MEICFLLKMAFQFLRFSGHRAPLHKLAETIGNAMLTWNEDTFFRSFETRDLKKKRKQQDIENLMAALDVQYPEELSCNDVMGEHEAQLDQLMEMLPDRIDAKKQSLHPWPYKKNAPFQNILKKDSYFGRGKATQQLA